MFLIGLVLWVATVVITYATQNANLTAEHTELRCVHSPSVTTWLCSTTRFRS
jgi:hypothetical protein